MFSSKNREVSINDNWADDDLIMQHETIFRDFNQIQNNMFQEFNQMSKKMLRGFDDDFLGEPQIKKHPFSIEDEEKQLQKFSAIHRKVEHYKDQGPVTCIARNYVSSSRMGQDGKETNQRYFSNNVVQKTEDGNTISEREQVYKNPDSGKDIRIQERMLNGQGKKLIQEKLKNGEVITKNHFYNLQEEKQRDFDEKWNQYNEKLKFLQNHQKFLQPSLTQQPAQLEQQSDNKMVDEKSKKQQQLDDKQMKFEKKADKSDYPKIETEQEGIPK